MHMKTSYEDLYRPDDVTSISSVATGNDEACSFRQTACGALATLENAYYDMIVACEAMHSVQSMAFRPQPVCPPPAQGLAVLLVCDLPLKVTVALECAF